MKVKVAGGGVYYSELPASYHYTEHVMMEQANLLKCFREIKYFVNVQEAGSLKGDVLYCDRVENMME